MKMRILAIGTALVAVATSLYVGMTARGAALQLEAEISGAERSRATLRGLAQNLAARLETAEAREAALRAELAASGVAPRTVAAAAGGGAQNATATARAATPSDPRQQRLQNDPHLQTLWAAKRGRDITREFTAFYERAKLTPEQVSAFEAALLKGEETTADLDAIATADPENRAAVAKVRQEAKAATDAALRQLLGDEAYQQLADYRRTLVPRRFALALLGATVLEGAPLSAQQVESVTQAIASASSNYVRGGSAKFAKGFDWDAADARVAAVLSPAQFQMYLHSDRLGLRLADSVIKACASDRANKSAGGSGG